MDTEDGKREHPARGTEHVVHLFGSVACHGSDIDCGFPETNHDRALVPEQVRGIDVPLGDDPALERLLPGKRRLVLALGILADGRHHVIELLFLLTGIILVA